MDVEKEEDKYIVTADIPGMTKENVDVEVEEGVLTISVHQEGETQESDKEKHFLHLERRMVNSSRRIRLGDIDEESIHAGLENGVLRVELPFADVYKRQIVTIARGSTAVKHLAWQHGRRSRLCFHPRSS